MSVLAIDLLVALSTALVLSWLLARFVDLQGPWRRRWAFPLVVFLFAWAGGLWAQDEMSRASVSALYAMPFVVSGLVAALLIVASSPRHDLKTRRDRQEFQREEEAVLMSVVLFFWALIATLVAVVLTSYLT